ncbi:adenylyl-sulfate kinase [Legionella erythra]|uniref:Adenylyl-sulfate kinase n=1 Tax=Legionella erythra TaxID=448 RepID=A0A0W0TLV8_LEGER|nr:adenylyl-sulfate kinase [Legionella erythra]KTC96165.1 elongation factor Tu (EF-Tu) [Legionella erythra]
MDCELTVVPEQTVYVDSAQKDDGLLRLMTCGSVDDGKSTLIGRLLWESQQLSDDQRHMLAFDSKKFGTQGDNLDFALLVDGLMAEREQGITIDVAYRYFSTGKRRIVLADTPGHEQYTRNMITGASTADAAILMIDARHGLLPQTRRHAYLAHLLGVQHLLLAINKMDLMDFNATRYHQIQHEFRQFAAPLLFHSLTAIPLSALKGDNVTQLSANTPWYNGPPLMTWLKRLNLKPQNGGTFAFPVQFVNHPHAGFRGYSGTITGGSLAVGDEIRVTKSGQRALVTDIIGMNQDVRCANPGDAVTLVLDKALDISRGDVLSLSQEPLQTTEQFAATLIWLNEEEGLIGRSYELKLATQWAGASISVIKHLIDMTTLTPKPGKSLNMNDIAFCHITVSKPLVFNPYNQCKTLGSFILVDRFSHATVAAGMIAYSLYRDKSIHRQPLTISRAHREHLNGHKAKVIWLTGLSGAGKSTLANALEVALHQQGKRTYLLDGDNIRHGLNRDLGFSKACRVENIRRVAEVARLMMDAGLIVIAAFVSPFRHERQMARELIGKDHFFEVHVSTPLAVCEQRDPKGLYRQARQGGLPNMTGIHSPYEAPSHPDYTADCHGKCTTELVTELMALLDKHD